MAKLFFVGLDGTERSYRLQTHRPFTVGRDPGNDIILRDPKVSRHHAEIVFERGFFVLHDLASANGTYVNAKRVRVAPLTHGAKMRMGNSHGRFSEELPTEADLPTEEPLAAVAAVASGTSTAASTPTFTANSGEVLQLAPTSQNRSYPFATLPHEKLSEDDLKKK
jgi:pSer/pThr/pTyr-binding forkhead associated (FHA) protein